MKKIILLDCYNHKIHTDGVVGTIVQHFGRWGVTNGWKIVEVDEDD